ncbi:MAG: hypothetical protein ACRCTZ_13695 [Sarcina sp.]
MNSVIINGRFKKYTSLTARVKAIGAKGSKYVYCFIIYNQRIYVIPFTYGKTQKKLINLFDKAKVGTRIYKSFTKLKRFIDDCPIENRIEHEFTIKYDFNLRPLNKKDYLKFMDEDNDKFWVFTRLINDELTKSGLFKEE